MTTTYIPPMGRRWKLFLYDPFSRLAGVSTVHGKLLDKADIRDGQRVLEIGCGTGNLLTALGRRPLDVEAVGIDPDPAALRKARRKARRCARGIRYERAFAGDLPLPDASFDRVLSSLMLHHLGTGESGRALREVRRVLRPGGQFHLVDVDHAPAGRATTRTSGQTVAALTEAGLTGAAPDGELRNRFGRYVFYRAGR